MSGKYLKVVCGLALIVLATFSFVGYKGQACAEAQIKIVAAHVLAPTHHYQAGFEKMKEIIERKTDGKITMEIYHSAALGEEEEEIEALQMGTIDITTVSAAPLTGFVKEYMACDLPFTFATPQEAFNFYDGEIGQLLFRKIESLGLLGLAWWDNGFRNFTNRVRPITSPNDMKGLKIRTMNSPVHMASVKALGASPVPIPFGELYTALQQGVVDGQENPIVNIYTSRFYEVQKYCTLSRHFYDPSPLFISAKTWGKLSDEQKEIVGEASIEARDYMRNVGIELEAEMIEKLRSGGMEVTELTPEQVGAFRDATKDVYKDFEPEIGKEFLDKFYKAAGR